MELKIESISDLSSVAQQFLDSLGDKRAFAFEGEMGAGKTTFILALLKLMGVDKTEGSPSYALVNSYVSKNYGKIFHLDLYRIENDDEALDIGLEEILYGNDICFIEWPQKINNLLPVDVIWSYIRRNDDNTRTLTIDV